MCGQLLSFTATISPHIQNHLPPLTEWEPFFDIISVTQTVEPMYWPDTPLILLS